MHKSKLQDKILCFIQKLTTYKLQKPFFISIIFVQPCQLRFCELQSLPYTVSLNYLCHKDDIF